MTSRRDKIRKLRALVHSSNEHEAALALAKAQVFEAGMPTAKALAHEIEQLLAARGMKIRVQRHPVKELLWGTKIDVEVRYRVSKSQLHTGPALCIEITEYDPNPRPRR
jgi:hypothetical protein